MQFKHTFLFTLLLGLGWIGYVFAYAGGPDTAVNGILGTSQNCTTGCHNSFAVNTGTGGVTLAGLPAAWTAGQTYALTVTVQPATNPTSRLYGFQLSAVIDSTNQQAGTLAKVNGAVQVICGPATVSVFWPGTSCNTATAVQFAEHSIASTSTTFSVNWTAPANASAGRVRFNVAGNAANGDSTNGLDHIYTKVYTVDAASAPDLSVHAYTMVDRGGASVITDGIGSLAQGYARIQPDSGKTTPSGVAVFSFRQNNVLIGETGVPATPKLTTGRIYAEISNNGGVSVDTGLAIANPNSSPANITFFYTDTNGSPAGSSATLPPFQVAANQQVVQFLDSPQFKAFSGTTFQGTFSFTSDQPIGVIAVRFVTNERTEYLTSTLPVIDTSVAAGTGTVVIPDFIDGAGWTTQILLVNPTDTTMTGTVQFTSIDGIAANVSIGGTTSNSFAYSVPGKSAKKLATAGGTGASVSGSVKVVPTGGGAVPTAQVVFSSKPGGFTVTEAAVPVVAAASAFRVYVETGTTLSLDTGIALANTSASTANVTLELTDLNGSSVATTSLTPALPPSGQTAKFFSDMFPSVPKPFKGVLRITSSSPISVVGVRTRINESPRGDFLVTTLPPINEASPASSAELLFPQIANGSGYTSQFVVFSGTAGQSTTGNLKFVKQDGTAFQLNVQ